MNPLPLGVLTLLAAASSLPAQIYADFTVSHGATPLGTFRVELAWDKAPRPVANFIGLATGQRDWVDNDTGQMVSNTPFYNGSIFQRLNHDFVIQGGDPHDKIGRRPGYVIQDQYHPDLRHTGRYILSMAKSSLPHTTGGQFFITLGLPTIPSQLANLKSLDDKHSIFGEVITNKHLIDNFTDPSLFPTNPGTETPTMPITMDSVIISGPSLASFDIDDPALRLPTMKRKQFAPAYDPATGIYSMMWDRAFQADYILSTSRSLNTLVRFRHFFSRDAGGDYLYNLSGTGGVSYYSRLIEVDYSRIPNAPAPLTGADSTMTATDRAGNSVTLTFDGAGGGTWSDSLGSSGTLSNVSTADGQGTEGMLRTNPLFQANPARLIPLGSVSATFDSAAGAAGWSTLSVNLSFHEPGSGFAEGSANLSAGGSKAVQQAFTYTP